MRIKLSNKRWNTFLTFLSSSPLSLRLLFTKKKNREPVTSAWKKIVRDKCIFTPHMPQKAFLKVCSFECRQISESCVCLIRLPDFYVILGCHSDLSLNSYSVGCQRYFEQQLGQEKTARSRPDGIIPWCGRRINTAIYRHSGRLGLELGKIIVVDS